MKLLPCLVILLLVNRFSRDLDRIVHVIFNTSIHLLAEMYNQQDEVVPVHKHITTCYVIRERPFNVLVFCFFSVGKLYRRERCNINKLTLQVKETFW